MSLVAAPGHANADAATITCLLVKVASRCNLSCDYCYMYEHADQLWRNQPRFLDEAMEELLARRVHEHIASSGLERISVVLHGGEPLLAGADRLAKIARRLREAAAPATVDVGIQTNGVLLDETALDILAAEQIGISLSLDGPADLHDLHRPTHGGGSSHDGAMRALGLLRRRPESFSGVIGVIDPSTDPVALVRWFAALRPPALDLLLPDATHVRPPPGRATDPEKYQRWLTAAFDTWYDEASEMPLRTFDSILAAVAGVPSNTDAFGLGQVSLLTVETDGSYHDLDVLKTTYEGRTELGLDLASASIQDAARSPRMREHGRLLSLDGLCAQCRACPEVSICGGGAVPHRYGDGGFENPSVYCAELLGLISHARRRVRETLEREALARAGRAAADTLDWAEVDSADSGLRALAAPLQEWRDASRDRLLACARDYASGSAGGPFTELAAASDQVQASAATTAAVQLWLRAHDAAKSGRPLRDLRGAVVEATREALEHAVDLQDPQETIRPALHRDEPLLRLPFGHPIVFVPFDHAQLGEHRRGLLNALDVIAHYSPPLRAEIAALCSDVQLVRDEAADPDKVVSFSDDTVPGALYVGAPRRWTVEAVYDIADSILHEHRHQKLYLAGRAADLVEADWPLVPSPWREEPRPPSGVLHAVFVFVELRDFWRWIGRHGPVAITERAHRDVATIEARLAAGLDVLRSCRLTPTGVALTQHLAARAAL